MKNAFFWDVVPCGSYKNRCFGGTYFVSISSQRTPIPSTANVHVTLMMEAIYSSETSVLTRATRRHILEDDISQAMYSMDTHLKLRPS
jgi:hypothetical protein